jgi:hypothetical protein
VLEENRVLPSFFILREEVERERAREEKGLKRKI